MILKDFVKLEKGDTFTLGSRGTFGVLTSTQNAQQIREITARPVTTMIKTLIRPTETINTFDPHGLYFVPTTDKDITIRLTDMDVSHMHTLNRKVTATTLVIRDEVLVAELI